MNKNNNGKNMEGRISVKNSKVSDCILRRYKLHLADSERYELDSLLDDWSMVRREVKLLMTSLKRKYGVLDDAFKQKDIWREYYDLFSRLSRLTTMDIEYFVMAIGDEMAEELINGDEPDFDHVWYTFPLFIHKNAWVNGDDTRITFAQGQGRALSLAYSGKLRKYITQNDRDVRGAYISRSEQRDEYWLNVEIVPKRIMKEPYEKHMGIQFDDDVFAVASFQDGRGEEPDNAFSNEEMRPIIDGIVEDMRNKVDPECIRAKEAMLYTYCMRTVKNMLDYLEKTISTGRTLVVMQFAYPDEARVTRTGLLEDVFWDAMYRMESLAYLAIAQYCREHGSLAVVVKRQRRSFLLWPNRKTPDKPATRLAFALQDAKDLSHYADVCVEKGRVGREWETVSETLPGTPCVPFFGHRRFIW